MPNIEDAIERIKKLECPTGDLELRIIEILNDFEIANTGEIDIKCSGEKYDDGSVKYIVKVKAENKDRIIVFAKSGMDDYVVFVEEAYLE